MQDPASALLNDASSLRRTPNQRRSKERVENMLNCAIALIEENGSDAMRMSDVAKRAGVSIGSLYQYFPDKSAIIQTLAERYNAQGKDCIKSGLAHVRTVDELCDAFGPLVDEYYALFLAEPVMRDIRSGGLGALCVRPGRKGAGRFRFFGHAPGRGDDAPCDFS